MMVYTESERVGERTLLMGNEAIARGAIEAGVRFATSYPGTPASEVLERLADVAEELGIHVEWSTNEMVAVEAAAAASFSGFRSITSMKQNGLNVIVDFLKTLAYHGTGSGGQLILVADDPQAWSSANEQDSRLTAKFMEIPILEPSSHQEAKDLIPYAFDLSERYNIPVVIRETTRMAHSRSLVTLGKIKRPEVKADFDHTPFRFISTASTNIQQHIARHKKLSDIQGEYEGSNWNNFEGPNEARFLVVTAGIGLQYVREALEELGLREETGLLKLTTLYPLPKKLIKGYLEKALMVLIVEEGESYLEENIRALCADMEPRLIPKFYGKLTDHIPFQGELTPDIVLNAICKVKNIEYKSPISIRYEELCKESAEITSKRTITFCPGCPHRVSYWCILQAIKQNGGKGIVTGDVGCYTLGVSYHDIVSTKQCMGASIGVAHGLGKLSRFGLEEPAIAVIGDSTFYHAGIPGLINCVYNSSDVTVIILDNNATAMTGFQPHPGTGMGSTGKTAPRVPIEDVCRGVGVRDVRVLDPFEVRESIRNIYECMTTQGVHVIIFRRECALLVNRRKAEEDILYRIDQEKCGGTKCKICSEQFNCPACIWDVDKAKIDEVQCNGCGVCATLCPYKVIYEVRAE